LIRNQGSANSGSSEVLIRDLTETEFDLLFMDFSGDIYFDALKNGGLTTSSAQHALLGRC